MEAELNQMIQTVDTYLALLAALVNFVFAILMIVRTSRTIIYITFFFICISLMIWNFGDFMNNLTGYFFWFYLSLIGGALVPAFGFHFVTTIVKSEKGYQRWIILAYICSGLLAFSSPLSLFHPEVKHFVGGALWNISYFVLLGPFLLASITILFYAYFRSQSEEEKSRLRYIVIASIITIFTGMTDLVQILKVRVPPLGHLGTVVFSSVMAVGVFKHRKAYDVFTQMQMKMETLRGMAEEALRKSEEKYRTILHSIEEGYYEVDLSGNMTFFNDSMAKILGYTAKEMVNLNNRQYMNEMTAKKVYEMFNQVYQTGIAAKAFDWELIRKDGTRRWVETSVSLIKDPEGHPMGFYGIARDITERKQAEEQAKIHQQQLMQAGKMVALGTLVSGVAHEINNPNNFIMLNTPLLKEAWQHILPILDEYYEENRDFVIGGMRYRDMRDRIPQLFSGISDGSKRIKQIVEDLRDFVRRDASDTNQSVELNGVLKSAVSLLSNMITKSTSHFSVKYGEKLPLLKGNSHRLEQVIINLIQNACQALPDIRRGISLSTSYNEKTCSIVVKVQDEGRGIPPENLHHITDPFFTTKSNFGGIGLGLSISSRIVKEHGGTLTFTSEPGKGTTAEIILPVPKTNHNLKGVGE